MSKEMSKADLMFKELGFGKYEIKKYKNNELVHTDLYYETSRDGVFLNYKERIKFYIKEKEVDLKCENEHGEFSLFIRLELYTVITEKMKELGWIE